jgi:hypothetical protein
LTGMSVALLIYIRALYRAESWSTAEDRLGDAIHTNWSQTPTGQAAAPAA